MELKWFEDFLSVSRCYSFTRAADERHITQSALSRRIRQLEEWLGVPLFNRNTYPITLTPEGQIFLSTASETLFALTHLRNDLHQRYQKRTSVLRFAMLNTLSLTFFPEWINLVNRTRHTRFIRLCDQKPSFVEHISLLHSGETDFLLTYAHDSVALIQQLTPYPMLSVGSERAIAVCRPDGEGHPLYPLGQNAEAIPWLSYGQNSFFAHALARLLARRPLPGNGQGHGCGHNLLGSAAMLAATALKEWLAKTGQPGRVRYYGCPAEEGGAAKSFMARAGAFDDVDVAITWHPSAHHEVAKALSLANTRMDFFFTGRASHAAAAPHLGRSALDAVELMNVGVQYLREHVPQDSRIHYAMLDSGGIAPNVVQAKAAVRYAIRARDVESMFELNARVKRVAEGAATMTDTQLTVSIMSAVANLLGNRPLEEAMQQNFELLGPVAFDKSDYAFADEIQGTLSAADIQNDYRRTGMKPANPKSLSDYIIPLDTHGEPMIGSTDVADVSWVIPTVQAHVPTMAIGTPGHSWQLTAQGKMPAAHKGLAHVAKIMAATGIDVLTDNVLLALVKKVHVEQTRATPYRCPIPAEVNPPVQPRPETL